MKKTSLFFALIVFSSFGVGMSIFDVGKACVFSEVNLKLSYNGKPAIGAKIWRRISWKKEVITEFQVDDQGEIELPAVYQRSVTKLLPIEFVVSQVFKVSFEGQEFEIWINSKRDPANNSELGGAPLHLNCELTDKAELHEEFGALLLTSCKW